MSRADKGSLTKADRSVRAEHVNGFRAYGFQSAEGLLANVKPPVILVALNAEKVGSADERVRRIVNENTGYADGMGVVLALRRKGLNARRIAGADLWRELLRTRPAGSRIYVIGGTKEVIEAVVEKLPGRFPELVVAGHRDGYLGLGDIEALKRDLAAKRPDVVLVGMGSPRQELLMDELIRAWPAVYMGLGGSLDIFVGRRRRAPRWMQRSGLEWIFRFVDDPRRLPRLGARLRFAWLLARGKL